MSAVVELFGHSAEESRKDWVQIVQEQQCFFLGRKCYKVRKSDPDTSMGACTVLYGKQQEPIMICPTRLIERRQAGAHRHHLTKPNRHVSISGHGFARSTVSIRIECPCTMLSSERCCFTVG